jgi:hypothetical protein
MSFECNRHCEFVIPDSPLNSGLLHSGLLLHIIFYDVGRFGLLPFRSPLLRKCREFHSYRSMDDKRTKFRILVSFPPGTKMFQFPGCALCKCRVTEVYSVGFPHSEISGSKVARHLPEAYRSRTTSFIASSSQGIHRMPLGFLSGNLTTASYITGD